MANVPGPVNTSYESLSKHQSNVFNSLRRSIKKVADMFAFGQPTKEIVTLMLKLYHENAIRNMSGVKDWVGDGKPGDKLNCMLGILQDNTNAIYLTISESPGVTGQLDEKGKVIGQSDELYLAKRRMLITLLRSAGITVIFPELIENPALAERFPEYYVDDAPYRWRQSIDGVKKGERDDQWDTLTEDALTNIHAGLKGKEHLFILDDTYNDNQIHIYDRKLREMPKRAGMTVYFVDSIKYLQRREVVDPKSGLTKEPTFRPYKKYKQVVSRNGAHWYAECNNGHLCTESKLFAYNQIEDKPAVISYVAYWIGKAPPPEQHIIRGYCFRTEPNRGEILKLIENVATDATKAAYTVSKTKESNDAIIAADPGKKILNNIIQTYENEIKMEKNQLQKLTAECNIYARQDEYLNAESMKRTNSPIPSIGGDTTNAPFDVVLANAVQPCAVVCPGCFANIQDYKDGKMAFWNSRNCYYSRASVLKGGKKKAYKKTKKQSKSKAKKTRKQTRRHSH